MRLGLQLLVAAVLGSFWILATLLIGDAKLSLAVLATGVGGGIVAVAVISRPFLGPLLFCLTSQQSAWMGAVFGTGIVGFADALTVLTVTGMVVNRTPRSEPGRIDYIVPRVLMLIGILLLLSFLLSEGFPGEYKDTLKFLGHLVLTYVIFRLVDSPARVKALVAALLISTAFSAGAGVVDYLTGAGVGALEGSQMVAGESRAVGSAGKAENASKMILYGTFIAGVLALRWNRYRFLTLSLVVLGVPGVAVTGTRGSLLAMAVVGSWLLFRYRHRRYAVVAALAVPVAAALTLAVLPGVALQRLESLRNPGSDTTAQLRYSQHVIALDLVRQHPALGIGAGHFPRTSMAHEYRLIASERRGFYMHDAYMAIAVENGLPAFLLFMWLVWVAWRGLRHAQQRDRDDDLHIFAEALEFALVSYMLTAFLAPTHRQTTLWILLGVALATARVVRETSPEWMTRLQRFDLSDLRPRRLFAGSRT